jgi:formylmethanofuran dehydrogenase subunit E
MKEIILKWLENRRLKFERLNCSHNWTEKERWNTKQIDLYTKAEQHYTIILYVCSKCGRFAKMDSDRNSDIRLTYGN